MDTQKTQTADDQESLVGVLLIDKESREQIGIIQFNPKGVLIYQLVTKELHVYAFKGSIVPAIARWTKDPLYVKYEELLKEGRELPDTILEREAGECAEYLNACKTPLLLGKHTVKALKVPIRLEIINQTFLEKWKMVCP